MLGLRKVAEVLIQHLGIHEGKFDVSIEVNIGVGNVASPDKTTRYPGAVFGVSGVGLARAAVEGPNTVDASVVNPAPKAAKKKARSKGDS